jgi:predicted transcriptional regulator
MQIITIGIQSIAELRAEMLAVARGERQANPDAPRVRFESLQALATALQTNAGTLQRVLLPAASSPACWWADVPRPAPGTDEEPLDE